MDISNWNRKSLLGIEELSHNEITQILELAKLFKKETEGDMSSKNYLRGKRMVNLFMEPSTRTRIAFEVAAKSLHLPSHPNHIVSKRCMVLQCISSQLQWAYK